MQSRWTMVQGVLAPLQFAVFLISLTLVMRYLASGQGLAVATASIVVKTVVLYMIMVTGAIWERDVFGRYLFAPAFFWEDLVSMLVLALHTTYLIALFSGAVDAERQMWLALAAYASYVINATQFVLKLRAARQQEHLWPPAGALGPHVMTDAAAAALGRRPRRPPGPARTRPARGFLRPDRHHLAASEDTGCVLPGRRLAHLRPSDPVRRRRDDLRRTALRHRDHR